MKEANATVVCACRARDHARKSSLRHTTPLPFTLDSSKEISGAGASWADQALYDLEHVVGGVGLVQESGVGLVNF